MAIRNVAPLQNKDMEAGAEPFHEFDFFAHFCGASSGDEGADCPDRVLLTAEDTGRLREILEKVRHAVAAINEGEALLIRLDNIRLGPEIAAPLGLTLYSRRLPGSRLTAGKPTFLVNPDPGAALAVHQALEAENDMGLTLYTAEEPWRLEYVGKLQNHLRQALDYLRQSAEPVTTEKMQEGLKRDDGGAISRGDAARRLSELYQNGLVQRKVYGRRFSYRFFHPCTAVCPSETISLPYHQFFRLEEWRAELYHEAAVMANSVAQNEADFTAVQSYAQISLELWAKTGNGSGMARAHQLLGNACIRLGVYHIFAGGQDGEIYKKKALTHFGEALNYYEICDDKNGQAKMHHSLGFAYAEFGTQTNQSQRHYERSIVIRRKLHRDPTLNDVQRDDNRRGMVRTLNNLANVHNYGGHFAAATANLAEAFSYLNLSEDWIEIAQTILVAARQAEMRKNWERLIILTVAGKKALARQDKQLPSYVTNPMNEDMAKALKALGPSRYRAVCKRGRDMTVEEIIEYASQHPTDSGVSSSPNA